MKITSLATGLLVICIIITSCTKEEIKTVSITTIDTFNIKDTAVQLLPDTISFLANGSPYTLTNYSTLTETSDLGWGGNILLPYHIFSIQAQDSFSNVNGNKITISIFTRDEFLLQHKTYGGLADTNSTILINFYNDTASTVVYESAESTQGLTSSTVTITSIVGDAISGTFQGALYYNGDSTSSNKKTITNGRFTAFY